MQRSFLSKTPTCQNVKSIFQDHVTEHGYAGSYYNVKRLVEKLKKISPKLCPICQVPFTFICFLRCCNIILEELRNIIYRMVPSEYLYRTHHSVKKLNQDDLTKIRSILAILESNVKFFSI